MSIREKMFQFATRPLLAFVALIAFVMMLFYFVAREGINRDTRLRMMSARQNMTQIQDRTRAYAALIGTNLDVQRGASGDQRHLVMNFIVPLRKNSSLDIITVHDKDGYALAMAHDPDHFGADESRLPSVRDALLGKSGTGYRHIAGAAAVSTTSPITLDEAQVGAVTVGYRLDKTFAVTLSRMVGADILVIERGRVIASSIKNYPPKGKVVELSNDRRTIRAGLLKSFDVKFVPLSPGGVLGLYVLVNNSKMRITLLLMLLFSSGVTWAVFVVIRRRSWRFADAFTQPIAKTAAHADRLARGDLDVEPLNASSRDEVGRLGESFNTMAQNLQRIVERDRAQREYLETQVRKLLSVIEAASTGDFSMTFEVEHDDEIGRVGNALNKMIHDLQEMIERDHSRRNYLEAQISRLVTVIESASTGDFSETFDESTGDEFARVGRALNKMVVDIQSIMQRDTQRRTYLENQVEKLLEVIEAASHGDFSRTFQVTRDDQVGRLGKALNSMTGELKKNMADLEKMKEADRAQRESLEAQVRDILQAVRRAAQGDLAVSLHVTERDAIGELKDNLNKMFEGLREMIGKLRENASLVERTSDDIQRISGHLRDGALTQVESVDKAGQVAAHIVQSIADIAAHADSMMELSRDASSEANAGGKAASKMVEGMEHIRAAMGDIDESMNELSAGAEKIEGIVRAIDEISDETNLLALNASIEAARAGDYGRGFAVVAKEVANLAKLSVESTRNITDVVRGIQDRIRKAGKATATGRDRVAEGLSLANESGDALKRIVEAVNRVTQLIRDIAVGLDQQKKESSHILDAMKSVGNISEDSAHSAREVAEAIAKLGAMADELNRMVEQFKVGD